MANILEIKNLCKKIDENVILNNISMTVKENEIYAFLGANGAGKTTLMKVLFGIREPDEGQIKLLGEDVVNNYESEVYAHVGNIIETPVFYKNLSAKENLEIHCDYMGKEYKKDIEETLEMMGLKDVGEKKVDAYSLGMKQRLALARAFLTKPKLLVLDEPINGLDPLGISDVRDLLLNIKKVYKTTILISSHIISEIDKIADTIGIIDHGVMLEEKSIGDIRKECDDLEEYFKMIVKRKEVRYA